MAEDAKPGHNVPKPEVISDVFKRVMNLNGDLDTLKGEHMSKCKAVREDIKQVYKDAKAEGIDVRAMKAKVKIALLEEKIEEVTIGLEGDQYTMLQIIEEAVPSKYNVTGAPLAEAA